MSSNQNNGLIFDIQRFSIHDGPGIRTTVFLKGCPLGCLWCHNPESQLDSPQLAYYGSKCIGCGRCLDACKNEAIMSGDERIDRTKCRLCGACAALCPSEALKIIGYEASIDEVVDVVMRDEPFYKTSGGGATISGGDPLYQPEFSCALLKEFKSHGLHTAVDTCGCGSWERFEQFISLTDLFLYDLKAIDPQKHMDICKADNSIILSNARKLAESGVDILFRMPVIPGVNDHLEDLQLLADFVLSLPGKHPLELMPYHCIGNGKYDALGLDYALSNIETPENIDGQKAALTSMGVRLLET